MNKFVFVIMPFKSEFNDIYQLGIKQSCKEMNCYSERVDEQFYEGSMLERIHNQIEKADFIIADVSEKNPNVFYEVGYAYALQKKVILITQNAEDIPFDMKHYFHIIYKCDKLYDLQQKIKNRLKHYLENRTKEQNDNNIILPEFYVNGVKLVHGKCINVKSEFKVVRINSNNSELEGVLSIAAFNPSDYTKINFCSNQCSLQLIYEKNMIINNNISSAGYLISGEKRIISLNFLDYLHPKQWGGKTYFISENSNSMQEDYKGEIHFLFNGQWFKYAFNCVFELKIN